MMKLKSALKDRMQLSKGKSLVQKRDITINGHRSSVSLEEPFWESLKAIAAESDLTLMGIVDQIYRTRKTANLSSEIRQFVLAYYQERAPLDMQSGSQKLSLRLSVCDNMIARAPTMKMAQ
jgi:predicted DNA-binding ribbon-helix-helix protein